MENSFKPQVEQAKADIRSIVEEMKLLESTIIKNASTIRTALNTAFNITSPAQLTALMNQITTSTNQLNGVLQTQTNNTNNLNTAKKTLKSLTAEEVINQRALAKNADLQAQATSRLVGAYGNLLAKRKIAANNLRNLISAEKQNTAEIKKAQIEYNKLSARVNQANKATSNFSKNSLGGLVSGFRNLTSAFGIMLGAQGFVSLIKNVFDLTKTLEKLDFTLSTITTSTSEFMAAQEFLEDITNRYGLSLITTTERFGKFLAASKQSNMSFIETVKIFESVSKASAVLGLKTDELSGVYLALEQMISKGKVTTEELRRQLGERLPGAFGIMATALDVSVAKLDEMLRKGQVLSSDALPKFAVALEEAYGIEAVRTVDTLVSAQERLSNAWISFVDNLNGSEGRLTKFFKFILNEASKTLVAWENILKTLPQQTQEAVDSAQSTAFKQSLSYAEKIVKMNGSQNKEISEKMLLSMIEENKKVEDNIIELIAAISDSKNDKPGNVRIKPLTEGTLKRLSELRVELASITGTTDGYTQALENLAEEEGKDDDKKLSKKLEAQKGSLEYLEQIIKKLEDEQSKLATSEHAYNGYSMAIEQAKENLRQLSDEFDYFGRQNDKVELVLPEIGESDAFNAYQNLIKLQDDLRTKYDEAQDAKVQKAKETNDVLIGIQETANKEEARLLMEKEAIFKDVFSSITETFSDVFDIDMAKFDFLFEHAKNTVGDWAELSKELIGGVLNASLNRYQIELQEAQRANDIIQNNELSTVKQKRLARQRFEEEERKIRTERAKAERRNALISIAVDTAVGVAKVLAQTGVVAPAVIPIIVGIGLLQAALVASQPLPRFADGHLSGSHSGKAMINDANRSKYKEVVERGNGQVEIYKDRNQVIEMKKGDKVHKSEESFLTYHNIEKDALNMSMQSHNEQLYYNGGNLEVKLEISQMRKDFKETANKMEKLAKRPIQNHNHITIEKDYTEY